MCDGVLTRSEFLNQFEYFFIVPMFSPASCLDISENIYFSRKKSEEGCFTHPLGMERAY